MNVEAARTLAGFSDGLLDDGLDISLAHVAEPLVAIAPDAGLDAVTILVWEWAVLPL